MMSRRIEQHELIRWAGLFTWGCVAIPLVMVPFYYGDQLDLFNYSIWAGAHAAFGAAYWIIARSLGRLAMGRGMIILLLAVMTAGALAVSQASESGLGGILILIISGLLPWVATPRFGAVWLVAMNLGLVPVFATLPDSSWLTALIYCALYLGYSSFTFVLSLVARREADSRAELRQLNSELRATRELLAESSRIAERVRIARDLHDVVGHHLTALSLNLETATHLVEGKALDHVERCRSLAKLLLTDVREVVGEMREGDELNLSEALNRLVEGLPAPRVHLNLPEEFAVKDPKRAQVIMRCVQEIITNAVRHARANNLWIDFEEGRDGLTLSARDDGRGGEGEVSPGHGLTGMSERLAQLGGRLQWESGDGGGFRLRAWLPLEAEA
jgi:signal transduction histidine kinase